MDLKGKVAIVTGASSGIGAATVKTLLNIGMKVVGFARRKERILELQGNHKENLFAVKVDLTKSQEILEGFDWVSKNVGPVDVLVNNAGVSSHSSILKGDLENWQKLFDTNFMSVAIACKEAVKIMNEHKIDGYIININSVLGYYDIFNPAGVMYRSSKSALVAMTENVRLELAREKSKIRITTLAPGAVKTDIIKNSDFGKEVGDDVFEKMPHLQPEDVSNTIEYLLTIPKHVHITELLIRCVGEDFYGHK